MKTTMAMAALVTMVAGGVAQATAPVPATGVTVQRMRQQRAVFDLVRKRADVRAACGGAEPQLVVVERTPGDVAAAIFSGMWYTPAHLQVVCAGR